MNTHTTNWEFVENGDTTYIDPASIIGTENIAVSNVEIQWRGVETTSTDIEHETNRNYGSAEATRVTGTDYASNTDSDSASASEQQSTNTYYADENYRGYAPWSGTTGPGEAQSYSVRITVFSSSDRPIDTDIGVSGFPIEGSYSASLSPYGSEVVATDSGSLSYELDAPTYQIASVATALYADDDYVSGDDPFSELNVGVLLSQTFAQTSTQPGTARAYYPSVPNGYSFDRHKRNLDGNTDYIYSNKVGQSESVTSYSEYDTVSVTLKTRGRDSYSYTRNDTTTVSYPSVPNGYNHDYHRKDGSYVGGYRVGDTVSITSRSPGNRKSVELETIGTRTVTNTHYTDDPSVSGDVSGQSYEQLTQGETSSWESLSGFEVANNRFAHSIGDSNEGYYRVRFDWEYTYPTPLAMAHVNYGGTAYPTRLGDTSDDALEYNTVRTYVPGTGVVAFDVVPLTATNASDTYVNHPTHGVLSFRVVDL